MKGNIIAKLTAFDEDKRERPHYKAQAFQTEKNKGIQMIRYLKQLFGIGFIGSNMEDLNPEQKQILESNKIKWTRDEKGNIISPWSNKAKELKKVKENEKENNR